MRYKLSKDKVRSRKCLLLQNKELPALPNNRKVANEMEEET